LLAFDQGRAAMSFRTFPMLAADVIPAALGDRPSFPFRSWAAANRFIYPEHATEFLTNCGSAAEAFFARPFVMRPTVAYPGVKSATADGLTLELQVRAANYWVDAVVSDRNFALAVEIDGATHHHWKQEQIAADYIRQRRIVLVGHTAIRFTAQEAFSNPSECWKQIEAILAKRAKQ
jgi:very-short-patch-repair endonuclease